MLDIKPFISVVIATRNRGDSVIQTVDSVLNSVLKRVVVNKESFKNGDADLPQFSQLAFEILVIDQSTDDRCQQAMQKYSGDVRVRYERSETVGMARARNLAIAQAHGELIAITDDDCIVDKCWLSEIYTAFSHYPDVAILFGNVLPGTHDTAAGFIPSYCRAQSKIFSHILDKNDVDGLGACMAMRKQLWQEFGGFDEMLGVGGTLKSSSEGDLVIHALHARYQVAEMPSVVVVHHGFRTWEEGASLIFRYWHGTGAMFGKHLKLYPVSTFCLLATLAGRWAFGRSRVANSLGPNTQKRARLHAFASGFFKGLWLTVNRRTGQFKPIRTVPQAAIYQAPKKMPAKLPQTIAPETIPPRQRQ